MEMRSVFSVQHSKTYTSLTSKGAILDMDSIYASWASARFVANVSDGMCCSFQLVVASQHQTKTLA